MHASNKGTWAVAVTVRAPRHQVDHFLAHYIGLGAEVIYVFFDDPEFADFDRERFSGKVIDFICSEQYWANAPKIVPLNGKIGRPDAVEIRQGLNALYAREITTASWLLHVDIDEFVYAKSDVKHSLSQHPDHIFSVLMRTFEAVYDTVKPEGAETDTTFFKKSIDDRVLLQQFYSPDMLKCATNGFWGTVTGKSFIRKGPRIKSMSVHWPTPEDTSLVINVPSYDMDLLHFEGQTLQLYKEKFRIRAFNNVAKHMPQTYKNRIEMIKLEYLKYGDAGLENTYKSFYVMNPETLSKAIELGVVVRIEWAHGKVSNTKRYVNNPIYDLGFRLSNWSGDIIRTHHNTYLGYDSHAASLKAYSALELLSNKKVSPVEIARSGDTAQLFVRINESILYLRYENESLALSPTQEFDFYVAEHSDYINISNAGKFLSASPDRSLSIDKIKSSWWERFSIRRIHPQI